MKIKIIQQILDFIRCEKNPIYDYIWNSRIKQDYVIIPIGTFCLPRVITVLCHLKRLKKFGEKTYPFDLAFFKNFDEIIKLIDSEFTSFYDDLKYQDDLYINEKINARFNHDGDLSIEEFKARYNKRIENFYNDIKDLSKKIFFIHACPKPITQLQFENFIKVIKKYRKGNFKIVLIYCNCKNENLKESEILSIIDDIDIISINKNGEWPIRLKKRKPKIAKEIFNKLNKELKRIIKN